MGLNVAVQMDPIERINIRGDSTFALLLEAQRRGHALAYYTPDRLALASKIIRDIDKAKPEVLLHVQVVTASVDMDAK